MGKHYIEQGFDFLCLTVSVDYLLMFIEYEKVSGSKNYKKIIQKIYKRIAILFSSIIDEEKLKVTNEEISNLFKVFTQKKQTNLESTFTEYTKHIIGQFNKEVCPEDCKQHKDIPTFFEENNGEKSLKLCQDCITDSKSRYLLDSTNSILTYENYILNLGRDFIIKEIMLTALKCFKLRINPSKEIKFLPSLHHHFPSQLNLDKITKYFQIIDVNSEEGDNGVLNSILAFFGISENQINLALRKVRKSDNLSEKDLMRYIYDLNVDIAIYQQKEKDMNKKKEEKEEKEEYELIKYGKYHKFFIFLILQIETNQIGQIIYKCKPLMLKSEFHNEERIALGIQLMSKLDQIPLDVNSNNNNCSLSSKKNIHTIFEKFEVEKFPFQRILKKTSKIEKEELFLKNVVDELRIYFGQETAILKNMKEKPVNLFLIEKKSYLAEIAEEKCLCELNRKFDYYIGNKSHAHCKCILNEFIKDNRQFISEINLEDCINFIQVNSQYFKHDQSFYSSLIKISKELQIIWERNLQEIKEKKEKKNQNDFQNLKPKEKIFEGYENIKFCPYCTVPIEKLGGCNFIICQSANCNGKKYFCFICGKALRESEKPKHFPNGINHPSCVNQPKNN
jgi:hypothetical protein